MAKKNDQTDVLAMINAINGHMSSMTPAEQKRYAKKLMK